MSYVQQSDLKGKIPDDLLRQALDDDNDGVADESVWESIATDVDKAINGPLEGRYAVPLALPYPAVVADAAVVFACEAIYMRRGLAGKDNNPWVTRADSLRKRLEAIGNGDQPLTVNVAPAKSGGALISEPARTYDKGGRLMV